jgi:hypothetical protein
MNPIKLLQAASLAILVTFSLSGHAVTVIAKHATIGFIKIFPSDANNECTNLEGGIEVDINLSWAISYNSSNGKPMCVSDQVGNSWKTVGPFDPDCELSIQGENFHLGPGC